MSTPAILGVLFALCGSPLVLHSQPVAAAGGSITVPAGTRVHMAMVRPVWAKKATPGDSIYLQTVFPVVTNGGVAIPAGSYVQGTIEKLTQPQWKTLQAAIEVRFMRLMLADGYTVELGSPESEIVVQATPANDLLLDNGAQVDLTMPEKLTLDAAQVARSIPLSHGPGPKDFKSASQCRDTPAGPDTSGTPDTVIPGSSGTPDTVIPGIDGGAPTVIPGMPATPSTVIPGTPSMPGSPGNVCPGAPMVLSSNPAGGAGTQPAGSGANTSKVPGKKG
jgi:hypothetical protein